MKMNELNRPIVVCHECGGAIDVNDMMMHPYPNADRSHPAVEIRVECLECGCILAEWHRDLSEMIDQPQIQKLFEDLKRDIDNVMTDGEMREVEEKINDLRDKIVGW